MANVRLDLTNDELMVQKTLLNKINNATGKERSDMMRDYGTFCHACRQLRVAAPLDNPSEKDS